MKLGKIIVLSVALVFIVSAAWAWNNNGKGHHGNGYHMKHQNCNGQQGEGFVDNNNDGICDNYVESDNDSDRNYRNCYASKNRMMKKNHCPRWQNRTDAESAEDQSNTTDNTEDTE